MKNTLVPIMIIIVLAAILGCKKASTTGPSAQVTPANSPTATATATISVDESTYPFEVDADLTGWSITNVFGNTRFTSMQISGEKPYLGSGSLKVSVDFNVLNSGGILSRQGTNLPMAGKTMTARVWVPADMFTPPETYGAVFFVQMANYNWYQSLWVNLFPGQWNTITAAVNDMTYSATALKDSADDGNTAILWGLRVGQGSASPNYSGYIYIDSITVE